VKYFNNSDSENQIKKALTKYRENNLKKNINNIANKTASTSDITKLNKNKSFKIDKKILSYAEPRTKIKEFHKIQPKILDSAIIDNNLNLDNFLKNDDSNTNKTIINENDDLTSSEFEIIENFSGINKFQNYNENSNTMEREYFLTDINEKKNVNELFDVNDINFDFLIMIEKLYDELIKDIEINKMDIYQNKLSIIKDLLYIYNSQINYNLYNILDNILLDNEDIFINNNKTLNKNNNNNNSKNSKYYIFYIIKEYFILQVIFFYTIILISLIKKEKNIFQSGIHSISFYFHQNIIILIYLIFSNFNLNKNKSNENIDKCINILNENKTWLDKNNYKKYIRTNNSLSKQIIINLIKQLKLSIKNQQEMNKANIKLINSISDFLFSLLINYNKRKIISLFLELKSNSSISDLFKKLNFDKILSHYCDINPINESNNLINDISL
jgi:hypothetical protein